MLNLLLRKSRARLRRKQPTSPGDQMKIHSVSPLQSAVLVLGSLATISSSVYAQQDHGAVSRGKYTLASVCGDYAAVATYGANVARALGHEEMDGRGKLTGSAIVNQPGPNNTTRSITSIGLDGTYTVNPDGSGSMILTITLPGGTTASVTEDFIITKSKMIDGVEIATEIQDAQQVPSAVIDESSLVVHAYTLRGTPHSCSGGHDR
jgi:hypothetical protein